MKLIVGVAILIFTSAELCAQGIGAAGTVVKLNREREEMNKLFDQLTLVLDSATFEKNRLKWEIKQREHRMMRADEEVEKRDVVEPKEKAEREGGEGQERGEEPKKEKESSIYQEFFDRYGKLKETAGEIYHKMYGEHWEEGVKFKTRTQTQFLRKRGAILRGRTRIEKLIVDIHIVLRAHGLHCKCCCKCCKEEKKKKTPSFVFSVGSILRAKQWGNLEGNYTGYLVSTNLIGEALSKSMYHPQSGWLVWGP